MWKRCSWYAKALTWSLAFVSWVTQDWWFGKLTFPNRRDDDVDGRSIARCSLQFDVHFRLPGYQAHLDKQILMVCILQSARG